jgi:hypothetical protein
VKNCVRIAVDFASNEAVSAEIPQKPKFRLNKKFLFFTASALIFCSSLGLAQSVKAEGTLTIAGIKSALRGEPLAVNSQQSGQSLRQYADDEAVSALSTFAQQIGAGNSNLAGTAAVYADRQFNDQAYAALRDFAQRLGAAGTGQGQQFA